MMDLLTLTVIAAHEPDRWLWYQVGSESAPRLEFWPFHAKCLAAHAATRPGIEWAYHETRPKHGRIAAYACWRCDGAYTP